MIQTYFDSLSNIKWRSSFDFSLMSSLFFSYFYSKDLVLWSNWQKYSTDGIDKVSNKQQARKRTEQNNTKQYICMTKLDTQQ